MSGSALTTAPQAPGHGPQPPALGTPRSLQAPHAPTPGLSHSAPHLRLAPWPQLLREQELGGTPALLQKSDSAP